jgi:hypothetical protein
LLVHLDTRITLLLGIVPEIVQTFPDEPREWYEEKEQKEQEQEREKMKCLLEH